MKQLCYLFIALSKIDLEEHFLLFLLIVTYFQNNSSERSLISKIDLHEKTHFFLQGFKTNANSTFVVKSNFVAQKLKIIMGKNR